MTQTLKTTLPPPQRRAGPPKPAQKAPPARNEAPGGGWKWNYLAIKTVLGVNMALALLILGLTVLPSLDIQAGFNAELNAAPLQAGSAASGASTATAPAATNTPRPTTVATPFPSGVNVETEDGVPFYPPVMEQGGSCIEGTVIDLYAVPLGANWDVSIQRILPSETEAISLQTDARGFFSTRNNQPPLSAGTYRVTITLKDGYREFTPKIFDVTLNGGDGCAQVRFKLEALGTVVVYKQDFNPAPLASVGLPGWEITAQQGSQVIKQDTDGSGKAIFKNLAPGAWTFTEEMQTGWQLPFGRAQSISIMVPSPRQGEQPQTVTFWNQQDHDSCIAVRKVDPQGNRLANWPISLTRVDGTQAPKNGNTDANGEIFFQGLQLGEWTVSESVLPGWRPVGVYTQTISLTEPTVSCRLVVIVNEPLGCVDGYKINDLNQGLSGWAITARNEATGETFNTTTDQKGYFRFNQLPLGNWTLSEEIKPGWEAVTPEQFSIDVSVPFTCQSVRFKNRTPYACLDVYKRDVDGNIGLPGWEITLQPAYGGEAILGITDGSGWVRFNKLTPGVYRVSEKLQLGWVAVNANVTNSTAPWNLARPGELIVEIAANGSCAMATFYNEQEVSRRQPTATLAPPPPGSCPPDWVCPHPCPPNTNCQPQCCRFTHTVVRGDTLYSLALKYNTTIAEIQKRNQIRDPRLIIPGMKLCIP